MRRLYTTMVVVAGIAGSALAMSPVASARQACPGSTVCTYASDHSTINAGYGCNPTTFYGITTFYAIKNNCSTRVWIHQNANNSGWAVCFSPGGFYSPLYEYPGNLQVTNNHNPC